MGHVTTSTAFAPSHITGFFQIFNNGSTGAGLNTDAGARTEVRLSHNTNPHTKIFINNQEEPNAEVSKKVITNYSDFLNHTSLEVYHEILSPIGYGLGMSGAGALSLSLALNAALKNPFSYKQCMEIAKFSEIQSGTGLGDVVAQQYAGIMMGLPPYPSEQIREIPNNGEKIICGFFEPLDTGKIIRDETWKQKINATGQACMEELTKDFSLKSFINLSRKFTFETGLASPTLLKVLNEIPHASMAMLGQTAFIISEDVSSDKKRLEKFTDRISVSEISLTGARVTESAI